MRASNKTMETYPDDRKYTTTVITTMGVGRPFAKWCKKNGVSINQAFILFMKEAVTDKWNIAMEIAGPNLVDENTL
jgi:hypothetical protein